MLIVRHRCITDMFMSFDLTVGSRVYFYSFKINRNVALIPRHMTCYKDDPKHCVSSVRYSGEGEMFACAHPVDDVLCAVRHEDAIAPGWTPRVHVLRGFSVFFTVGVTAE